MKTVKIICPKCGEQDFEILVDEVDIGVGIQKHTYGGVCGNCGEIDYCDICGAWNNLLVKRCDKDPVTKETNLTIVLKQEQNIAEVVAVGPGREGLPMVVKPGDMVLLAKYIGVNVVLNGVEHILVKAYDCQAIVEIE